MKNSQSRRPLKILYLARGGPIDGSQRQIYYLLRGMDRSRFEPVVVLDREGALADLLLQHGIKARILPMHAWRSFPAGLLRYWDALRITLWGLRQGADLVHACDVWKSGYLIFMARLLRTPSVLHVRGPMAQRDVLKLHMNKMKAVIPIAQRYKDDLQAAGISPDRIEVIDDAVDLERFRPGLAGADFMQEQFGVNGEVTIGLVGRVERFKRVPEFLEVIAELAKRTRQRFKALVIGQPKNIEYQASVLDAARRLGLENHVLFAGRRDDMGRIMSGLDILVTMSGGSTMFEAMACATPVLSVRTDERHSLHTRHNETALCVTTSQAGPAAEALAQLVDDPALRQRLGQAGRAWVETHLSPATLVEHTQNLYARLIGK